MSITAALMQMTSGRDIGPNVDWIEHHARAAAGEGARFILTPETCHLMETRRKDVLTKARCQNEDEGLDRLSSLAAELGVFLLVGSLVVRVAEDRLANRSFLIDGTGLIVACYDKIHLFDVELGGGERYRESALYDAGDKAVVADTPFGRIGLTVCYDVRFPYLYRALAKAGADIICVPSAFTRPTGAAHWHALLRARAIETGCYILAPAQCGIHACGRETYGHSLAVSPWGEVLADGGPDTPGVVYATLDRSKIADARAKIPSLMLNPAFEVEVKEMAEP